jgi:hypothetical protein
VALLPLRRQLHLLRGMLRRLLGSRAPRALHLQLPRHEALAALAALLVGPQHAHAQLCLLAQLRQLAHHVPALHCAEPGLLLLHLLPHLLPPPRVHSRLPGAPGAQQPLPAPLLLQRLHLLARSCRCLQRAPPGLQRPPPGQLLQGPGRHPGQKVLAHGRAAQVAIVGQSQQAPATPGGLLQHAVSALLGALHGLQGRLPGLQAGRQQCVSACPWCNA